MASTKSMGQSQLNVQSKKELQKLTQVKHLRTLLFPTLNKSTFYNIRRIPKRSGQFRTLHIPKEGLKKAQKIVLLKVLNKIELPDYLWAFEPNRTLADLARVHAGKECVVSLDLKDYFGSIKPYLVKGALANYGVTGRAAEILTELTTYKHFVPQGACTSPKISNMVTATTFGEHLKSICDECNVTMSIYADDITLSFNPEGINRRSLNLILRNLYAQRFKECARIISLNSSLMENPRDSVSASLMLIMLVRHMISTHGFRLSNKKTKIMGRGCRHWVCGVVANEKPNISREQRSLLRAMVHNLYKNGVESEAERYGSATVQSYLSSLRGKLAWYKHLNPERAEPLVELFNNFVRTLNE